MSDTLAKEPRVEYLAPGAEDSQEAVDTEHRLRGVAANLTRIEAPAQQAGPFQSST